MAPRPGLLPSAASEKLRGVRNFVAGRLARAYGRDGALRFVRVFLDPERWRALRRDCFREAAS